MRSQWKKKRQELKEKRKNEKDYTFWDIFLEILFWFPEIFIWPFRILLWLIRGCGKLLKNLIDFS